MSRSGLPIPSNAQRGWKPGDHIGYHGVEGVVERAIGHDLLIRDADGRPWRIRHDNADIVRV